MNDQLNIVARVGVANFELVESHAKCIQSSDVLPFVWIKSVPLICGNQYVECECSWSGRNQNLLKNPCRMF